jgi:hypothetical protein
VTCDLPDTLTIFGRTFTIKDLPALSAAEGVIGLAAYHEAAIYLDRTADPALTLTTLWHEAIHIVQNDLRGRVDEDQARWISLFVHNLLVHNPAVIECYSRMLDIAPPACKSRRSKVRR